MPPVVPSTIAVGTQRWYDLLFLHWPVSPATVQATLPEGLVVDTFGGDAWVGIVPFAMARVRPRFLPPVPWLSWFLELNVRTYVRDAQGTPGVWFYSLDCNQPVAVEIARRCFHLPYQHAAMQVERRTRPAAPAHRRYRCTRRGEVGAPWSFAWDAPGGGTRAPAGSLEEFLVERYALYCADARRRLYRGYVAHAPYCIGPATLHEFSTGPAALAGFALAGPPRSVLAAEPVDVTIHRLERLP